MFFHEDTKITKAMTGTLSCFVHFVAS